MATNLESGTTARVDQGLPRSLPQSLAEWLAWLERIHPKTIAMGLERVSAVRDALAPAVPLVLSFPVITVGGTNGKGSTCAMLESILTSAGYRVGCYSSPHLLHYNERVRIDRHNVSDDALCRVLAKVEAARGTIPLTYFEFGTLAAMQLFIEAGVDVAILEVGLGGRLDAVNAFDTDCAVITSIDMDHMDYLGDTRESIAFEKAGIFRADAPAICADTDPPQSLLDHAIGIGARLIRAGVDYSFNGDGVQWQYRSQQKQRFSLPYPALRGACQLSNAGASLAALDELRDRLPIDMRNVREGLLTVDLAARFQVLPGRPVVILDVAHNPQAAQALATNLGNMRGYRKTIAVFAMLNDKDLGGVIRAVLPCIDQWLIADLRQPRGAQAERLSDELIEAGVTSEIFRFTQPSDAYQRALELAGADDRIIVFGSFYTVADVMRGQGGARDMSAVVQA
ncbi:MAG: bifunctional tetrahydrofolate synthase/dihydrofolate synthase [Burkholderiales bacterium]|nr:bifunctional tetrahydrofolate synthase/dihydrofolate synthase [Burkholderiales bacterium]MDQ3196132.1 bifunctional tetrahydrofolate synthase/dihydrofolate synthase [Pseudomonadota bacterium]